MLIHLTRTDDLLGYALEMQSSGPAARPGLKFRPGRAFCGARTTSAGLLLGSREAILIYYALAAGLRAVLKICWPGSMLELADFVRCRYGLGLGFWKVFAPLLCTHHLYLNLHPLILNASAVPPAYFVRLSAIF